MYVSLLNDLRDASIEADRSNWRTVRKNLTTRLRTEYGVVGATIGRFNRARSLSEFIRACDDTYGLVRHNNG